MGRAGEGVYCVGANSKRKFEKRVSDSVFEIKIKLENS